MDSCIKSNTSFQDQRFKKIIFRVTCNLILLSELSHNNELQFYSLMSMRGRIWTIGDHKYKKALTLCLPIKQLREFIGYFCLREYLRIRYTIFSLCMTNHLTKCFLIEDIMHAFVTPLWKDILFSAGDQPWHSSFSHKWGPRSCWRVLWYAKWKKDASCLYWC